MFPQPDSQSTLVSLYLVLNKKLQEQFGLPLDRGALIINEGIPGDTAIIPGSASDKAGLKEFDIILTCNNKKITDHSGSVKIVWVLLNE